MSWNFEKHATHYRETLGGGVELGQAVDLVGALESAGLTRPSAEKAVRLFESTDRFTSIEMAAAHVAAFSKDGRDSATLATLEEAVGRLPAQMVLSEGRAYAVAGKTATVSEQARAPQSTGDSLKDRAFAIIRDREAMRSVSFTALEQAGLVSELPVDRGRLDEAAFQRRVDLEIDHAYAAARA